MRIKYGGYSAILLVATFVCLWANAPEGNCPLGALVGTGYWSEVFEHGNNQEAWVVKRSFWFLDQEFRVGRQLHHNHIVQVKELHTEELSFVSAAYELFMNRVWRKVVIDRFWKLDYSIWSLLIDRFHGKPFTVFNLVMERVHGSLLKSFYEKALSPEQVESLLEQVRKSCLYLFDQRVRVGGPMRPQADWHGENVMIEQETGLLKLIDLGYWEIDDDVGWRGWSMLQSAQRLLYNIVSTSNLVHSSGSTGKTDLYFSFCPHDAPPRATGMALVRTQLTAEDFTHRSEREVREILEDYLQSVLDNFQQAVRRVEASL